MQWVKETGRKASDFVAWHMELAKATGAEVIVHCRTGHRDSQTLFVLKHLLGYPHVRWYDAGWTEWAARKELPVANDEPAVEASSWEKKT